MMTVRAALRPLALLMLGVVIASCGGQQEPAQQAIANAEATLNAMRPDAQKYAPDELKEIEDAIAGMKANYAKKDYSAVLTVGREMTNRLQMLSDTIASRREEQSAMTEQLTEQWNTLSVELPELVEAVSSRVEAMDKSGKLPKGVDQATFDRAKADTDTMKESWQAALGAFSNGNMQEAVDMAQVAKEKASSVMTTLNIS